MKHTHIRALDDKTLAAILNDLYYRLGGLTRIAIRQRRLSRLLIFAIAMLYGTFVVGFLMPLDWYVAIGNALGDVREMIARLW